LHLVGFALFTLNTFRVNAGHCKSYRTHKYTLGPKHAFLNDKNYRCAFTVLTVHVHVNVRRHTTAVCSAVHRSLYCCDRHYWCTVQRWRFHMRPAQRTVGWGGVLDSWQVRTVRNCLSPPSSGHKITTLLFTWCETLKVQGQLEGVSFIVPTNLAVLFHREPASAGTTHESFRALGTTKETLRTLAWHTPNVNSGDTLYVPNFIEIRSVVSDKTQREGQFRFHVMWQIYTPTEDRAWKV